MIGAGCMLSVFIREPEFQGQTKDRLATAEAQRIVEACDQGQFRPLARRQSRRRRTGCSTGWSSAPRSGSAAARKRKSRARARRASCACPASSPTAPTPPRKARRSSSSRATRPAARPSRRATAPPRPCCRCAARSSTSPRAGKDKLAGNQQLADLVQALGCGTGVHYRDEDLRYEKVIVMTDADVDGAHIASLLITFFYRQMPQLIERGHLYLAVPPLYRLIARRQDVLCAQRRAPRRAPEEGIPRQRQGRDRPLQGPRRDDGGAAQGNHHGPEEAHAAEGHAADRGPRRHAIHRSSG